MFNLYFLYLRATIRMHINESNPLLKGNVVVMTTNEKHLTRLLKTSVNSLSTWATLGYKEHLEVDVESVLGRRACPLPCYSGGEYAYLELCDNKLQLLKRYVYTFQDYRLALKVKL